MIVAAVAAPQFGRMSGAGLQRCIAVVVGEFGVSPAHNPVEIQQRTATVRNNVVEQRLDRVVEYNGLVFAAQIGLKLSWPFSQSSYFRRIDLPLQFMSQDLQSMPDDLSTERIGKLKVCEAKRFPNTRSELICGLTSTGNVDSSDLCTS